MLVSLCYLLTNQGVQWSQGEPGTGWEQTQPSDKATQDRKGHSWDRGHRDNSCLCFLSHSSSFACIHLHILPFALLSVLLYCDINKPQLSGPDNSPACLLSVFAEACSLDLSVEAA